MAETATERPVWRKIWLFCSADFGFNLYYSGLSLFLLYYYTDVVGIRPAVAGLIFAVPLLWDAVTDPLMGAIASRVPSRHGRFRVFVLFGVVPLAISFVLMFAGPLAFPGQVVLVASATHVLFRTAYTVVSIPYSALSANMVSGSAQRGSLAGIRMIFATTGGLFTVIITLPFVALLGGDNPRAGFAAVAVIYALLSTGLILIAFFNSKDAAQVKSSAKLALGDVGRTLVANRALLILVASVTLGATGLSIFGKMLLYFMKYVAGVDLPVSIALIAMTAMASLSIPFWMVASRRLEKRQIWLIGSTLTAIGQLTLFLMPLTEARIIGLLLAIGFANGAFYVTFWSMLPDTIEYGEWKTGVRDEGLVFGVNQLALKAAAGIGIGALGFLLEASGYIAGVEQGPETVTRLHMITTLLPCGLCVLGMVVIAFYPIDRELHGRLVRALDRARQGEQNAGTSAAETQRNDSPLALR